MKQTTSTVVAGLAFCAVVAFAPMAHADVATTTGATSTVTATATSTATTTPTTVTGGSHSTIQELMDQLAKLTALFNSLKAQLMGVQTQIQEVRSGLGQGATGDDVKSVQDLLSTDPTIYPSGLKTGFFGPMTVEAIKRFQTKNGLEVTGTINAETKAALDALLKERRDDGHFKMGLMMSSSTKGHFEDRLREHCGLPVNASTTVATTTVTPVDCNKIGDKYHFEMKGKGLINKMMNMFRPDNRGNSSSSKMMHGQNEGNDDNQSGHQDDNGGNMGN